MYIDAEVCRLLCRQNEFEDNVLPLVTDIKYLKIEAPMVRFGSTTVVFSLTNPLPFHPRKQILLSRMSV
jgi:hypothetical protein